MDVAVFYLLYLSTAGASGLWAYRDARARALAHPRSVALAVSLLFPFGILWCVVAR